MLRLTLWAAQASLRYRTIKPLGTGPKRCQALPKLLNSNSFGDQASRRSSLLRPSARPIQHPRHGRGLLLATLPATTSARGLQTAVQAFGAQPAKTSDSSPGQRASCGAKHCRCIVCQSRNVARDADGAPSGLCRTVIRWCLRLLGAAVLSAGLLLALLPALVSNQTTRSKLLALSSNLLPGQRKLAATSVNKQNRKHTTM